MPISVFNSYLHESIDLLSATCMNEYNMDGTDVKKEEKNKIQELGNLFFKGQING